MQDPARVIRETDADAVRLGKTLVSAAVAKLFLRSGNASRILFLVDRLELEIQAHGDFTAYLGEDGIRTVIFKENRGEWRQAEVVVTTIQSLATAERYRISTTRALYVVSRFIRVHNPHIISCVRKYDLTRAIKYLHPCIAVCGLIRCAKYIKSQRCCRCSEGRDDNLITGCSGNIDVTDACLANCNHFIAVAVGSNGVLVNTRRDGVLEFIFKFKIEIIFVDLNDSVIIDNL